MNGPLANAKHRLDEMTLVLQHKMDSERELLELSEALQNELVRTRANALNVQNNVENKKFLHCKYIGSTQYSFWQCYISNSNLAVVSTADDCAQPTTVSKFSIQSKKLAFPKCC